MNIREFAFNLEKVYEEMSSTFSLYQKNTGLQCPSGCGRCCTNPGIEASVLEMIPFALKIYDQGQLEEWIQKLEERINPQCVLLQMDQASGKTKCLSYHERPSVCRMFGVAGTYNKHQEITLAICKLLKELNTELPRPSEATPLIPHWTAKLTALDPELSKNKLPINLAMKGALEKIAFYTQYQVI
jgi:Fe-S-cluster containining protein